MQVFRILAALTLIAAPLVGQTVPASNAEDLLVQRLQALMDMPNLTAAIRDAGVPDSTVRSILNVMEQANLPEPQQAALLVAERDAARESGPANNFGAFVQSRLAAGDRGQTLAKAIRAEHARLRGTSTYKQDMNDSARASHAPRHDRGARPEIKDKSENSAPDHN